MFEEVEDKLAFIARVCKYRRERVVGCAQHIGCKDKGEIPGCHLGDFDHFGVEEELEEAHDKQQDAAVVIWQLLQEEDGVIWRFGCFERRVIQICRDYWLFQFSEP